jgi:hypothetical protein
MRLILTETDVLTALRGWAGMSDYNITVHLRVDVQVRVEDQPMLVRLRKVNKEWEWYGARMQDPQMEGGPSEVIQWLKANKAPVRH